MNCNKQYQCVPNLFSVNVFLQEYRESQQRPLSIQVLTKTLLLYHENKTKHNKRYSNMAPDPVKDQAGDAAC
jgi:hypothetical protein